MDVETQAVLFDAVPLLTVAALSLAVGATIAFLLRRDHGRSDRPSPAAADRGHGATTTGLSQQLLDASEPSDVAKVLLDGLAEAFELDLANMALIEDGGLAAVIVAAREGRSDNLSLVGKRIALDREASGINAAVREGRAFTVYDAEHSAVVNQRLNAIAKAKSCVYVPVRAADEVIGVVFGAVRSPRVFDEEELGRMQAFVSEGGLALERSRATLALADALERERLISHVSLELRSRRNVDEVLPAVLAEIGVAVDAARCFVKLGDDGDATGVAAEWHADGVPPLGDASRLPVVNLCARLRRTVAVADVLATPALDDGSLGDVRGLSEHGVHAVLATPILAQERLLGVLAFHRSIVGDWSPGEIALAEAVAREAAVALDTSRLLRESDRRLAEQQALLKAGEALTSDLRFDVVIERLVSELRALVNADAADCWTLLPGGFELVCRAVMGLPEEEVGRTIPVAGTIGEAITTGKPVLGSGAAFAEVMDAPISSFGEIRGALGVYSREAGRFEESDLRLIEAFASLASIALRNAEAYEESTRRAQVERGFYRIAAVLSEPLSEQETLDAVAQAAADALGGDSAAVLRGAGAALELAGCARARRGARGASPGERVVAGGVRPRRQGARVPAAPRGRPLRRRPRGRRGGGRARLTARRSAPAARWRGSGPRARLLRGRARVRRRSARARGAGRGGRARRARAQRALRARTPVRAIWRSGSPSPAASSPASSIRTTSSTHRCATPCSCSGPTVPRCGCSRATRWWCARSLDRAGSRRSTRALPRPRWLVGDIVQTRATRSIPDVAVDPRVGEADAMLAAGYGGYLGVPMIGPEESATGHPRRLLRASARMARGGGRGRCSRSRRPRPRHAPTPSSTRASATSSSAARRSWPMSPTGSSPSTATARSCSGTRPPSASPVSRRRRRSGKTPTEALGRPLEAAEGSAEPAAADQARLARRSGSRSAKR